MKFVKTLKGQEFQVDFASTIRPIDQKDKDVMETAVFSLPAGSTDDDAMAACKAALIEIGWPEHFVWEGVPLISEVRTVESAIAKAGGLT